MPPELAGDECALAQEIFPTLAEFVALGSLIKSLKS